MSFSAAFLTALIYGALGWCAAATLALIVMLVREAKAGDLW